MKFGFGRAFLAKSARAVENASRIFQLDLVEQQQPVHRAGVNVPPARKAAATLNANSEEDDGDDVDDVDTSQIVVQRAEDLLSVAELAELRRLRHGDESVVEDTQPQCNSAPATRSHASVAIKPLSASLTHRVISGSLTGPADRAPEWRRYLCIVFVLLSTFFFWRFVRG